MKKDAKQQIEKLLNELDEDELEYFLVNVRLLLNFQEINPIGQKPNKLSLEDTKLFQKE